MTFAPLSATRWPGVGNCRNIHRYKLEDMDSEDRTQRTGGVIETVDIETPDDHDDYPEGGIRAWMVVVGAWCAMIPPMGLLNTLAVLQAWFSEHELKGTAESTTGWIFSSYAFFITACGAQVGSYSPHARFKLNARLNYLSEGPIFDAYNIKWLLAPGSLGLIASMIFLSFSTGEHSKRPTTDDP